MQKLEKQLKFGEPGGCCDTEILKGSPLESGNTQVVHTVDTSIIRSTGFALWSPKEWTPRERQFSGSTTGGKFGYELLMRPREHAEVS